MPLSRPLTETEIRYIADIILQAKVSGFLTGFYIFGASLATIIGIVARIMWVKIARVDVQAEDISIIKSHEEGRQSFSRGLYKLAGDYGILKNDIENLESKLDHLIESHEKMAWMGRERWDGINDRRGKE